MEFVFSEKAEMFRKGIFAVLNEKKKELEARGRKVYNLSVGTPDFKPAPHVIEAVSEAAKKPENYKYALEDKPELLQAVKEFYQKRFGVELETEEIMSINGSQEGMAHFTWTLCNPGDLVLAPNPGYPIFSIGPALCDARVWFYPLSRENGFLPKLDEIPEDIARQARFMVVSYPLNPVCAAADDSFYEKLIAFAKRYQIVILHDNAYSDIIYGGRVGGSFLAHPGAKEVGVEFYSLSKSYNLTGARISFVVGNRQIVDKFKTIRSQIDYGVFLPVQYGAIAALTGPQEAVQEQCAEYERRMRALCGGLRSIGWNVPDSQGTMFVWAPVPAGFESSEKFCMELMERSGVLCTPGSSFGTLGEGYVRFALVLPPEEMEEVVKAVAESKILGSAGTVEEKSDSIR
ncbi:MAG: aminotransferase class I/II-fold pyridoxal phosphate-dependent enzyme [Candidatus Limivivens sp.]|nr:aminotransferase class I/II-fold pyridoxal phosphate-dependent enzyme [Candidatus Limivivens sp.]